MVKRIIGILYVCLLLLLAQSVYAEDNCAQYRDRIIEPEHNIYSLEEESALGASILKQKEYDGALNGGGIYTTEIELLRSIEQKLRPFFPDYAKNWAFSYKILPGGDVLDATTLPGGMIVVHEGTFTASPRADVVAGVLAHEIAHVVHRHGTRVGTLSVEYTQKVLALLMQDVSLLTMDIDDATASVEQRIGPAPDIQKVKLEHELLADIFAARVVSEAGFDLSAHERILVAQAKNDGAYYTALSEHPLHSTRAEIMRCFNTGTRGSFPVEDALLKKIQKFYGGGSR